MSTSIVMKSQIIGLLIEKDYKTIFQIVRSFTKAETDLIFAPMF
ncbi:hypothetical protein [Bacillus paramycoides]